MLLSVKQEETGRKNTRGVDVAEELLCIDSKKGKNRRTHIFHLLKGL